MTQAEKHFGRITYFYTKYKFCIIIWLKKRNIMEKAPGLSPGVFFTVCTSESYKDTDYQKRRDRDQIYNEQRHAFFDPFEIIHPDH